MGGTQDNGTWSNNSGCATTRGQQVIYGDGGNAVYDATNATWRSNEFTSGFSDSNFRNGDPERWVITTAPLVNSGEAFAFYWPQIGDPNPVAGTAPDLLGWAPRLADLGLRCRYPGRGSAGHDPGHRLLRGELSGVHRRSADRLGCGDYQARPHGPVT